MRDGFCAHRADVDVLSVGSGLLEYENQIGRLIGLLRLIDKEMMTPCKSLMSGRKLARGRLIKHLMC